jgi:glycosyltransferase involved in cell wall biosynthesis
MKRSILLITHPVDLGNAAFQRNLCATFRLGGDLDHVAFAAGDLGTNYGARAARALSLWRRAHDAFALRDAFRRARREARAVVIQGVSAALFTAPLRRGLRTFIIVDWTRKLYEPILGSPMSPPWLTRLHRNTMLSAEAIVCLTEAVSASVQHDYRLPQHRVWRARMPFGVDKFRVSTRLGDPLRILFVGADLTRKGADILLDWYAAQGRTRAALTLVTSAEMTPPPRVRLLRNDPRAGGFVDYADYDVLALPSRCDAYPQVLGEAASAGLAIATTAHALGAPEIVEPGRNGFIARSADEFKTQLDELCAAPRLVEAYKANSRRRMLAEFTPAACWERFERRIFGEQAGAALATHLGDGPMKEERAMREDAREIGCCGSPTDSI